MDVEEEQKEHESDSLYGKVYPPIPPPRDEFGESATQDWSDTSSGSPDELEQTQVQAPIPHTEKIRHNNIYEKNKASTRDSLDRASGNQHLHVDCESADNGGCKEDGNGN